ncbi:MAG: filamentous hemagglutinin N-terminal domain-containing protein [Leptolyngbyaceae cyanobacterium RU_5_1]|nr:filamentous hemagglutinin N-terminal domain-containing protein [Leptolyngbyaceae cyanobacterium RU_5_1]
MTRYGTFGGCQVGLATVLGTIAALAAQPGAEILTASGASAIAQIAPDSSLGNERSQVTPSNNIRGLPGILIQGGAIRGANLFQSFSEFNVGEAQRVYFANPSGIQNILSRVTGSNPSNILGTLGVDGSANLFLLNPNGILFGRNARLDIAGSFVASTADSLVFENGLKFSATHPEVAPLLTLNLRPGLQYGTNYRGPITNAGDLSVGAGQTLALAGSTVTHTGSLTTPGGTVQVLGDRVSLLDNARIDVSSIGGGGTILIGGDFQGNGQVPNATQTFIGANVIITADGINDGNGGRVIVWANDSTRFYGTISAQGGANSGNGGFVEVSGKQALDFNGRVDAAAPNGLPGTLLLDPANIEIVSTGGGGIPTNTINEIADLDLRTTRINVDFISNATADVILQATNNITFSAPINITAFEVDLTAKAGNNIFVNNNITTNAGEIALSAGSGIFINGAIINTNPFAETPGTSVSGSIGIVAGNQVSIVNSGVLGRKNNDFTSGFSAIGIAATQGSVLIDRSTVSTTNRGTGVVGDVVITARDRVTVLNSDGRDTNDDRLTLGIFSQGNQGRIFIGASEYSGFDFSPRRVVINNSLLRTSNGTVPAGSSADAGTIIVQATDSVSIINNSQLRSTAVAGVQGNGGGIGIGTRSLLIDNSNLSTSTFSKSSSGFSSSDFSGAPTGFGDSFAGAVVLLVDGDITLNNSDIFNNLENEASGEAGFIFIAARNLSLLNGSQIQTLVRGADENGGAASGTGGNILISVDRKVEVVGRNSEGFPSSIFSSVGRGADGTGGNILIEARSLHARNGGRVDANNLGSGPAGNIFLFTKGVWLDNRARITASSLSGQGGNIFFDVPGAIILGRNSNISTSTLEASTSFGEGAGNIAIGSGRLLLDDRVNGRLAPRFSNFTFLVAGKTPRDNNIFAVGIDSDGGNIRINTFRLQDIAQRPDTDVTNDITTESILRISGTTVVNTLDVFPSFRADPLPDRYIPPTIAEGCDPRARQETSRFIITGRGGLPADPNEVLTPDTIIGPSPLSPVELPPSSADPNAIVPARGWVKTADGTVRLTAHVTDPNASITPYLFWSNPEACYSNSPK